ncbi:hypothetical protein K450DRAFT_194823, partial [Umbelopsis ramanniana AG]
MNGHCDTVDLLINHGAAVDGQNERLRTALHLASEKGDMEVVGTLLHYRASVD